MSSYSMLRQEERTQKGKLNKEEEKKKNRKKRKERRKRRRKKHDSIRKESKANVNIVVLNKPCHH